MGDQARTGIHEELTSPYPRSYPSIREMCILIDFFVGKGDFSELICTQLLLLAGQHQFYSPCERHLPAVKCSCRFHQHHTLLFAAAVLLTSPWTKLLIAHERFLHVGTCVVFFMSESFKIPIPNFLSY